MNGLQYGFCVMCLETDLCCVQSVKLPLRDQLGKLPVF